MPPAVQTIHDERRTMLARCETLIATARAAGRDFTDAEAQEYDGLKTKLAALATRHRLDASYDGMLAAVRGYALNGAPAGPPSPGGDLSFGALVAAHDVVRDFLARRGGAVPVTAAPFEVRISNAALVAPAGGWTFGTVAPPSQGPRPLMARDLFTSLPAEGGTVPYARDPGQATAADIVAEGAQKPETSLVLSLVNDQLVKVAHWAAVGAETMEDVAGFTAWLNSVMALGVIDREDAYIAATLTALAGKTPDRPMAAGENAADAILAAAMAIQTASKLPVDGVILSANVYQHLVTMKSSGSGDYLTGSPLAPPTNTLWGRLALAVSPNVAPGTAIIGAFRRACAIYRRGAIRIDMTDSHADFFTKNLVAIVAEQRELLASYTPKGIGTASALVPGP